MTVPSAERLGDPRLTALAIIRALLDEDADAIPALWPDDLSPSAAELLAAMAGLAATEVKDAAAVAGLTAGEYLDTLVRSQVKRLT